ncbi:TetR/AcrR family transcriptional regulator [Pseudonocardia alaniniphila]|uniref:TetR/AcrR family transcriptional regulator n=1 Tax=Pseudonocardia alaniniphila TaxID=75291 RepID=A0ABS9TLH9_9PSEU|nr:TetR/AcrR family transcriptional regulator [Pseudonocardia alaniniphila]MCH6169400.1 TetR/AcrR family transcriptional regulator [Pseudonocardia alaniniphila]
MTSVQSGGGDFRRSLELLWGTPEEPTRGPRPGLSVQRIVRAAIDVADAEGLAALSMRRIASALGVGAMSLYRYVPGKAELIDLMVDEVYAEDLAAERAVTGDWRERLEEFGRQEWALYLRHPWMLQIAQGRPMLGPNSMASTDVTLLAVDGIGLDEHEMLAAVVMLSSFVSGLAKTTIEAMQAADSTGVSDEEWWEIQGEYVGPAVVEGKLPMLSKVGEAGAFTAMFDNFEFGLQRVLDGLAVLIEARRGTDLPERLRPPVAGCDS